MKRDTINEQHPPAFSAQVEIASLRDGLRDKLAERGVSAAQVARMETTLPLDKPDRFQKCAGRALFFAARFARAMREKNPEAAAFYALQVGRAAQEALDNEEKVLEAGWGPYEKAEKTRREWAAMLPEIVAQIERKAGLTSAREVHGHLKIEERHGWNIRKFQREWTKAKLDAVKASARK